VVAEYRPGGHCLDAPPHVGQEDKYLDQSAGWPSTPRSRQHDRPDHSEEQGPRTFWICSGAM